MKIDSKAVKTCDQTHTKSYSMFGSVLFHRINSNAKKLLVKDHLIIDVDFRINFRRIYKQTLSL